MKKEYHGLKFSDLRVVLAAIFLLSICSISIADESLRGWKEFKRSEDLWGTYDDYQKMELYIALEASGFISPNIRLDSAEGRLRYIHGDAPQIVRLLLWLQETEPEIRQEYILQWLSEKQVIPEIDWTAQKLRQLLVGRREEAIEKRISELEAVYKVLPRRHDEVQSNTEALKYKISTLRKAGDKPSALDILDDLTEEMLFDPDPSARKRIYYAVCPPMRKRNGPKEYADPSVILFRCLSIRESDTEMIQYFNTEFAGATNVYEVAWRVLDSEAREERGEKVEDPFDSMLQSPLALEYEEAELKRRRK